MEFQNIWCEKSPEKSVSWPMWCGVIARLILSIVIAREHSDRGNLSLSMSS